MLFFFKYLCYKINILRIANLSTLTHKRTYKYKLSIDLSTRSFKNLKTLDDHRTYDIVVLKEHLFNFPILAPKPECFLE